MANINYSTIKSINPDVLKTVSSYGELVTLEIDYCVISTRNYVPHEKLIELSKTYPNELIRAQFTFGENNYSEEHFVEYRNGKHQQTKLKPVYNFSYDTGLEAIVGDRLLHDMCDKAANLFSKLDEVVVVADDKHKCRLRLVYPDGEVSYTFLYGGYKVEAYKNQYRIDLLIYQRTGEWEQLEGCDCLNVGIDPEGEYPF